ncbi:hypothetical protein K933_02701, partial [Candidatus Halobonum tyrrellensis G22]
MSERRVRNRPPDTVGGRLAAGAARVTAALPAPSRAVVGLLALLPVAATTLYRVLHNAPVALPDPVTAAARLALPAVVVASALAALLLAATAAGAG